MIKTYVVTGGGGFVGHALCRALRREGHTVIALARGTYPELAALGVRSVRVDIGQERDAAGASWWELFKGAAGVFHTAAKVDMWGRYEDFFATNVQGTRNIIAACQRAGVPALVFTSSPSVVHDGSDLRGVDESYPYPQHFDALYPQTKAQAEQEVCAASGVHGVHTVALRPHLIWGPGDTNLIPTVLARARAGRLMRIGDGENLVDLTYIDDCVSAHLAAMRALEERPAQVGGRVYFISQGEPVRLWWWIDEVLKVYGVPPVSRSIGARAALLLARVLEVGASLLRRCGVQCKPLLTPFLVSEMYTSHYFSIERARTELGYQPRFSIAQGLEVLRAAHAQSTVSAAPAVEPRSAANR
jgi:nucleoside-diphosphate-sugar epimerase